MWWPYCGGRALASVRGRRGRREGTGKSEARERSGAKRRVGGKAANSPILDLLRHRQERLLDIRRVLRTCLQHRDAQLVRKLLGDSILDDLLADQIALVADEELVDALARVPVNLLQPLLDVGERVGVRDVVDDDDAVRAAVVGRGDGAEPLLSCRVPLRREKTLARVRRGWECWVEAAALQRDGGEGSFPDEGKLARPKRWWPRRMGEVEDRTNRITHTSRSGSGDDLVASAPQQSPTAQPDSVLCSCACILQRAPSQMQECNLETEVSPGKRGRCRFRVLRVAESCGVIESSTRGTSSAVEEMTPLVRLQSPFSATLRVARKERVRQKADRPQAR